MSKFIATSFLAAFVAAPVFAEADLAAGEKVFSQCQTCHVVADPDGNILAGRNARQGPNLYGMPGRQAGLVEGFRYGKSLVEAGEKGLVWDEESFVAYVENPNTFLRDYLGNNRARGNMAFRLRNADDAKNVYAYIASLSPAVEVEDAAEPEVKAAD